MVEISSVSYEGSTFPDTNAQHGQNLSTQIENFTKGFQDPETPPVTKMVIVESLAQIFDAKEKWTLKQKRQSYDSAVLAGYTGTFETFRKKIFNEEEVI